MHNIGIDLGGTNIAVGVVDEKFNIVGRGKVKTNAPRPAQDIVNDMVKACHMALEDAGLTLSDIDSVGIGAPGSINPVTGVIATSGNLQFTKVPMVDMIKEQLDVKCYIENDANAAAYGEYIAGAGKGTSDFVTITLGTGVGCGIIVNGKLYSGYNNAGGELGHIVISYEGEPCNCGRRGCWEAYASATALIRQTKEGMKNNNESVMWELTENNIDKVSGRTAFDAMRKGDATGKQIVEQYVKYLACGVTNVVNIFQPQILCVGGGVSHEGETLLAPLRAIVEADRYSKNVEKQTEIREAQLGNDAGIIGAAWLCNLYNN